MHKQQFERICFVFFHSFIYLFILLLEIQETRIKRKYRHLLITPSRARNAAAAVAAAPIPF